MTYIILPANEVQDQCKKLLEEIYNVRRYRDEIQIREQMLKKRRKWNLSPWYFTREQAIENLVKWSDFWGLEVAVQMERRIYTKGYISSSTTR